MPEEPRMPLVETFGVQDVFVSCLGQVENLGGGCFRFTFAAKQHIGDREELVVVAKLIAPMEAVPPAVVMAAEAVGLEMVRCVCKPRLRLN